MSDEAETVTGTALDVVPVEDRNLRGLEIARSVFPPEDMRKIAQLLAVPDDSPALEPFLALCVAEGFSPWANHVWLIPKKVKVPAADGEGEQEIVKHLPMVGRDGLLHRARNTKGRPGGFRGIRSNVVCEKDTFEVRDDGWETHVLHEFASKPTAFDEGVDPGRYRGKILGAWAKVYVDGEPPTFYFASVREHARLKQVWAWNESRKRRTPLFHAPDGKVTFEEFVDGRRMRPVQEFEGAWDYLSTMILKSAQSYALRIALGVTGFVPADELRSVEEWQQDAQPERRAEPPAQAGFDFEQLPESVRDRVREAVEAMNERQPHAWSAAKCDMVLKGRSAAELERVAEQIEAELGIVDAQVVDELADRRAVIQAQIVAAEEADDQDALAGLSAQLDQVNAEIEQRDREAEAKREPGDDGPDELPEVDQRGDDDGE